MLVQAKNAKGFTLVELIVVITILAILATIGFLSLQGYTSDAKNTKTQANLRTVASSLVNEQAITQQGFDKYMTVAAGGTAAGYSWSGTTSTTHTIYGANTGVSLTGGTSYYAGALNANALRIDGSKFFDNNAAGVQQPYAVGTISVNETSNGKSRLRTLFQVAGTLNNAGTETALVEGTYGTGASTDLPGLLKGTGSVLNTVTAATSVIAGGTQVPYSLK